MTTTTLSLKINGKWQTLEKAKIETLNEFLEQWPGPSPLPPQFALAINGTFIPKRDYGIQKILDKDEVEIISPHPGG